jgi:hypothetical protein
MKWFDRWLYSKVRDMWDNRHNYENEGLVKMNVIGSAQVERGKAEGEDRISFELTSAVGGRILNVRRYDERKDRHETQTYVIPSGEDVGARVAKILNLELMK